MPPAEVNGEPADPSRGAFVVLASQQHVLTTEYVVRKSGGGWVVHPATFVKCAPYTSGDVAP